MAEHESQRYDSLMAYEIFDLPNSRFEVRCAPGDIVHIAFDYSDDTWTVEEDPQHILFQNRGEAVNRARLVGRDPDFVTPRAL